MAIKVNLVVDQGTTFQSDILLTNDQGEVLDLTNYTGAGKIKKHYSSANSVSVVVELNVNTGVMTLKLDANTSNNMRSGRYVYDVELTQEPALMQFLES
jgi:hypothetical protein